ncbi:MAGE-domain-containing protein [Corynespora cassiicola Philippines]|uniref:MAGE-domain-containing protein n=1 Tax=Corynespora cassiicola Philippines TaxID=1448308 RepID=A0A2T2NS42_CORCC|nr:MAGE-domain-containing protein [Corynespora cassiicola Philippines]
MPPSSRKRRAPADEDAPTPTQTQRARRQEESPEVEDELDKEEQDQGSGGLTQLSKALVRYALACEYSRTPIRRQDVNNKVLGANSRAFKQVFDSANGQLMEVFGMRMAELPVKEKVTIRQKRAAAGSESQNKSSNQWVLQSTLPKEYRTPEFLAPPRIPTADHEAAYVGLYTMIIALISLGGGQLQESKLERYLKRMNAEQTTPVDKTTDLLKRMAREGYLHKVNDSSSGEELTSYMVGPRGKVEVGEEGVANFVRAMYGESAEEDLEQRLARSLGIVDKGGDGAANGEAVASESAGRRPGRPRRHAADDDDDY